MGVKESENLVPRSLQSFLSSVEFPPWKLGKYSVFYPFHQRYTFNCTLSLFISVCVLGGVCDFDIMKIKKINLRRKCKNYTDSHRTPRNKNFMYKDPR